MQSWINRKSYPLGAWLGGGCFVQKAGLIIVAFLFMYLFRCDKAQGFKFLGDFIRFGF